MSLPHLKKPGIHDNKENIIKNMDFSILGGYMKKTILLLVLSSITVFIWGIGTPFNVIFNVETLSGNFPSEGSFGLKVWQYNGFMGGDMFEPNPVIYWNWPDTENAYTSTTFYDETTGQLSVQMADLDIWGVFGTTAKFQITTVNGDTSDIIEIAKPASGSSLTYSEVIQFPIMQNSPNIPILTSPENVVLNQALTGSLEWTTGDNTDSCTLYLADNSDFNNAIVVENALSPYNYPQLDYLTTYYWKVVAINNSSNIETESGVWSFSTMINPNTPDEPVLTLPGNGAQNQANTGSLEWTTSENTDRCTLYLADNSDFNNAVVVDNALSLYDYSQLEYLNTYYWKVVAVNNTSNIETESEIWSFTTQWDPNLGSGTEADPYQISTLDQLIFVSENSLYWDKHYIQTTDIDASTTSDLSEGAGFSPIGNSSTKFTGTYDGQDHTISNLYINRPETSYVGLFGYTIGADISNLGLDNCNIEGDNRVGGLVGNQSYSTISNSYSTGQVAGDNYVGGLVGYQSSYTISNSYSTGQVSGDDYVGGLVGYQSLSTISNSYSIGAVTGNGNVGGLIGYNSDSSSNNSFWDIEASGQSSSAGGSGKTTEEMQNQDTYVNWDFDSIWMLNSGINNGYPFFYYQNINNISIANNSNHVILKPTISFEIIDNYQYYEVYFGPTPNPDDVIIPFSPVSNPVSYSFTDSLEYYTDYYWTVLLYDENYNATSFDFTFETRPEMDGLGTEDNPYTIKNLDCLMRMSSDTYFRDKHFLQTADIEASPTSELYDGLGFSPIGYSYSNRFTGSYDGQGHTISNLSINRPESNYIGLFGYIEYADISNLGLDNCNIEGNGRVGGLVGYQGNYSTISNSYTTGTVNGNYNVGGMVGYQYYHSTIANSYTTGTVNGNYNVGGMVGYQYYHSTIANSYSTGLVTGNSNSNVGGLIGYNNDSSSNNSFWDIETSGQTSSAGGSGLSTDEMKSLYTYLDAGWDFIGEEVNGSDEIWCIHPSFNGAYPFFANSNIDLLLHAINISPSNELNNVSLNDNLLWDYDYLENTSGYRISLGTDNPPTNVINNQDLGLVYSYEFSNLQANSTYYWQVIPYNENGDAEDCPIWSFTTGSANIVSVGCGEDTNVPLPINPEMKRSYSQSIYLQSELNLGNRHIEKLSFYLTDHCNLVGSNEWKVYIGHTNKSEFDSENDWLLASQGLTQVANITVDTLTSVGWIDVELDSPFAYNNIDNIIVGVLEYSSEYSTYYDFYTVDSGNNRSLSFGHDTTTPNPNIPYGGQLSTSIPKINFTFSNSTTNFTGLVKNSLGEMITDASINVSGLGNYSTNSLGQFNIYNAQATSYNITVSAPWYEEQVVEFEVLEGQDNFLEVTLLEELLPASNLLAVVNDDLSGVQLSWQAPQLARMESQSKASKSWQKTSRQGKASKRDLRTGGPAVAYNLYSYLGEEAENPENWTLVASNITELTYEDTSFPTLELGDYYWAVEVVYSNNRLAEPVISNEVIKESLIESSLASQIDFGIVYLTNSSDYTSIEITNIGNGPLEISNITCDNLAFDLVYDSGDMLVGANATFIIDVNFTPDQVQTYNGTLLIENNSSNESSLVIQLHGVGQYLPPANPENVQLTMSSTTAQISWDAVTEDIANNPITPDMYIVYFNGQNTSADEDFYFLATTTDLSYTHVNVGAFSDYMFYRVKAYVDVDNVVLARINQLTSQKRKVSQEEIEKIIIGNVKTNRAKK